MDWNGELKLLCKFKKKKIFLGGRGGGRRGRRWGRRVGGSGWM